MKVSIHIETLAARNDFQAVDEAFSAGRGDGANLLKSNLGSVTVTHFLRFEMKLHHYRAVPMA